MDVHIGHQGVIERMIHIHVGDARMVGGTVMVEQTRPALGPMICGTSVLV